MPRSQYHDVDYPLIDDLEEYRQELRETRSMWDQDKLIRNDIAQSLLQIGEILLEYYDFLGQKHKFKVRIHCWINILASLPEI